MIDNYIIKKFVSVSLGMMILSVAAGIIYIVYILFSSGADHIKETKAVNDAVDEVKAELVLSVEEKAVKAIEDDVADKVMDKLVKTVKDELVKDIEDDILKEVKSEVDTSLDGLIADALNSKVSDIEEIAKQEEASLVPYIEIREGGFGRDSIFYRKGEGELLLYEGYFDDAVMSPDLTRVVFTTESNYHTVLNIISVDASNHMKLKVYTRRSAILARNLVWINNDVFRVYLESGENNNDFNIDGIPLTSEGTYEITLDEYNMMTKIESVGVN